MSEICKWSEAIGLDQYGDAFEANKIDMDLLGQVDETCVTSAARIKPILIGESEHKREVRPMPYARCSECGQTIQVESVSNDVMMMWHGTHCGSSQAYFADKEIFETADDLEKKKPVAIRARAGSPRLGLAGLKAAAQARRARLVVAK
jgi:hypothetical protein